MNDKSVLVTGSTGFVGRHVTRKLLEEGYLVYAIVRDVEKLKKLFPEYTDHLVSIEVKNPEEKGYRFYIQLFERYNIERIVHMAALSREYSNISFDKYLKINVDFTKNIYLGLKYLNKSGSTFIFVSTAGVYGTIPWRCPANEEVILKPNGKYHISKKIAEETLQKISNNYNVRLIILRPIIMYGYYDLGFLYNIFKLHRKHVFPLIENIKWHLLDVEFFSNVVLRALRNRKINGVYNVADKRPIESREMLDFISRFQKGGYIKVPASIFYIVGKITPETYKIKMDLISKSWYYDISKLKKAFNIVPPDTFQSLEKKYLGWYTSW